MTQPALTYVDSTILFALISEGPTGDAVRRWFRLTQDAWISSEIALTRTLLALSHAPMGAQTGRPHQDNLDTQGLLRALTTAVAIRPLPQRLLSRSQRPAGALQSLAIADALELAIARLWRCRCLISNCAALQRAAQAAGLSSLGIGAPSAAAATVGDWPRRSPIPP